MLEERLLTGFAARPGMKLQRHSEEMAKNIK